MALSNAEKQARFRNRNVLLLTGDARDIAAKLIEMVDQKKLRMVVSHLNDHLALKVAAPPFTTDEEQMTQRSVAAVANLARRRGYLVKQNRGLISMWDRFGGKTIFQDATAAEVDAWLRAQHKREARAWPT
jgi:hypothetical protein